VAASSKQLRLGANGTTGEFTIQADDTIWIQSDVGIGTNAPTEELQVDGYIMAKDRGVLAGVDGNQDGFVFHDLYTAGGDYYG